MGGLSDIAGLRVGHAHDAEALTGCTVVLAEGGAVGGVDVRGGGPGTRETDLLNPVAMVERVHAIVLCGGSAFGLAAAQGVVNYLYERGVGFDTGVARVPIVPAAVIFDLGLGRSDRWPDPSMGYAACLAARAPDDEGSVGVGMGASAGKLLGVAAAVKTGVGVASEQLANGVTVAALVVTNAFGDLVGPDGAILAGTRDSNSGTFADSGRLLRSPEVLGRLGMLAPTNTTLAVVATDARLGKAEATKLAQMAHDGLARTIRPVHTPFDGDTVFALATGQRGPAHLAVLGSVAADVLARAVWRSAALATAAGGLPAATALVPEAVRAILAQA
jgi:L-aminopeptidase/D-esterase-like protein